jgi:hypothetical protein
VGSQVVKKFPSFDGTRTFITAFTRAHHLSLSRARSIQSMSTHPISWRSVLVLPSHLLLCLPSGLCLSFPHQNPVCNSPRPHTSYMPAHLILLDLITLKIPGEVCRSLSFSLRSFLHSRYLFPLRHNIPLSTLSNTISPRSSFRRNYYKFLYSDFILHSDLKTRLEVFEINFRKFSVQLCRRQLSKNTNGLTAICCK